MVARVEIENFLDSAVSEDIDLIVSTPRKGSWIIDDYLLKRVAHGRTAPRHITVSDIDKTDSFGDLNVMVFDDSVHTASTVMDAVRRIRSCGRSLAEQEHEVSQIGIRQFRTLLDGNLTAPDH